MQTLQRLSRDDGVEILANFRNDAADPANIDIVRGIVDFFGGLAIGIVTVGAYMQIVEEATWQGLADELSNKGLGTVTAVEAHIEAATDGGNPVADYSERVNAVIAQTFDALPAAAQRTLEYAALLPQHMLYRPWLITLLQRDPAIELTSPPGVADPPEARVIDRLETLGLLEAVEEHEETLALHAVRGDWLLERLRDDDDRRTRLLDAIEALARERATAAREAITNRAVRPELIPLAALGDTLATHDRHNTAGFLANKVGLSLKDIGWLVAARGAMERALAFGGQCFNGDHPILATRYSNLAITLRQLGDLKKAREYMLRAIAIGRQHHNAGDLRLATRYSNLAITLRHLGEHKQARAYMLRAISIGEQHFDADHPTLATRYSNLALILRALGEFLAARNHMNRAIAIDKQRLDAEHPTLAIRYSNLATILQDLDELKLALRYMERAIAIGERHFDTNHPKLAMRYSNLAMILHDLDDLGRARRCVERAIAIWEKHFGTEHPNLATSYNNLAWIELADGNRSRACALWRQALDIRRKHFPDEHQYVQTIKAALAEHSGDD